MIGRQPERWIRRAPKRGPQSFLNELLRRDVLGYTMTRRARDLGHQPMLVHNTYYGDYRPGTAQRIPPVINTGYGGEYATSERVRSTLIARARLLRSSRVYDQGTNVVDAGRSQAARAAGA